MNINYKWFIIVSTGSSAHMFKLTRCDNNLKIKIQSLHTLFPLLWLSTVCFQRCQMTCRNLNSSTPTKKEDQLARVNTCHTNWNTTDTRNLNIHAHLRPPPPHSSIREQDTNANSKISCSPATKMNSRSKTLRKQNPSPKNKPPQLQIFQKNATHTESKPNHRARNQACQPEKDSWRPVLRISDSHLCRRDYEEMRACRECYMIAACLARKKHMKRTADSGKFQVRSKGYYLHRCHLCAPGIAWRSVASKVGSHQSFGAMVRDAHHRGKRSVKKITRDGRGNPPRNLYPARSCVKYTYSVQLNILYHHNHILNI